MQFQAPVSSSDISSVARNTLDTLAAIRVNRRGISYNQFPDDLPTIYSYNRDDRLTARARFAPFVVKLETTI